MLKFSLQDYINNPMGKSNAVLNAFARENIRNMYSHKFDNILLRENNKIEYRLYKDNASNTYWVHVKSPSEEVKGFYYDVVFKFSTDNNQKGVGENLFDYNVQFYSNDPAFVYTYAYVFSHNGLMIKELLSKMVKSALMEAPKEKNPTKSVGYVKHIYFAYLLMKNRKLNNISKFMAEAKPMNFKELFDNVEQADSKIQKRKEKGSEISHKKKIVLDKDTARRVGKFITDDTDTSRLVVTTTKSVGKITNKLSTKESKNVKKVKRK